MNTCRLIPFDVLDGPHNMAADEVMLNDAIGGNASLRLYGWSPATLSLGYFQAAASRLDDPLLAQLPYVRRATGGETLVHDRELTYALAVPSGQAGMPWHRRMHEIIQSAFFTLGVDLRLSDAETRDRSTSLCFPQIIPNDVLCGGVKVVGSAQRKSQGALLQHGGILLARSEHAPRLPGIRELQALDAPAKTVRARIIASFTERTGWQLVEKAWTAEEEKRIDDLARHKYGHPSWNDRR